MRIKTYNILRQVINDGGFANLILKNVNHERINQITIRVYGILQNYFYIDYIVTELSEKKKLDSKTRLLLMMATYEKLYLDNIDDYVIISEYQKISKKLNLESVKYISFYLNNNIKKTNFIKPRFSNELKNIAIEYSHPLWVVKNLSNTYENYIDILKFNNKKKITTIRSLEDNLNLEPFIFDDFHRVDFNVLNSEMFLNNKVVIQDLGSYLVTKLLNVGKNDVVLDLCAAPGSKSIHLSKYAKWVYSNEINESRCLLLNNNINKYDIINLTVVNHDATEFNTLSEKLDVKKFKKILVDAPCSGSGTLRSKPELRLRMNIDEINKIIKLQRSIFDSAYKLLDEDGEIVYSTCSIFKMENEDQIEFFCNEYNLEVVENLNINNHVTSTKKYGSTLLNYTHNTDGFFMCKLKRKKS